MIVTHNGKEYVKLSITQYDILKRRHYFKMENGEAVLITSSFRSTPEILRYSQGFFVCVDEFYKIDSVQMYYMYDDIMYKECYISAVNDGKIEENAMSLRSVKINDEERELILQKLTKNFPEEFI